MGLSTSKDRCRSDIAKIRTRPPLVQNLTGPNTVCVDLVYQIFNICKFDFSPDMLDELDGDILFIEIIVQVKDKGLDRSPHIAECRIVPDIYHTFPSFVLYMNIHRIYPICRKEFLVRQNICSGKAQVPSPSLAVYYRSMEPVGILLNFAAPETSPARIIFLMHVLDTTVPL